MTEAAMYELGRTLHEDRLREAAARRRLWRSNRFRGLPRFVQVLLAAIS
jgi:hypothetical protein